MLAGPLWSLILTNSQSISVPVPAPRASPCLCVQAAYEVEPASYAMALRTFKTESLSGEAAMTKLREGINREILVRAAGVLVSAARLRHVRTLVSNAVVQQRCTA